MPIYEYYCHSCSKRIHELSTTFKTGDTTCNYCGGVAERQISRCYFSIGTKKARIRDGFQPGFQPALGINVETRSQYDKILKERGLVELGKETQRVEQRPMGITREDIKRMRSEDGINMSDREADAVIEQSKEMRKESAITTESNQD